MRASEFITEEAKAIKTKGLTLKYAFNDSALLMKAFEPVTKSPLAFVKFVKEKKELYPENLWVHDDYRSRGIAKTMYDTLKSEGYVINRSHDQTKAGSGFWDKHRGEDVYVWEEINPDIKNYDFKHKQEIGDYVYTAEGSPAGLTIRCLDKKGNTIGRASFMIYKNHLESMDTKVASEYQGKGIASTMYAYAKMLGNDVKPSPYLLPPGKKMWDAWKKSGEAKHIMQANEEVLDEMPLPADWDPAQYQQGTTFKQRLAYALERAKKLGTGSSRVATTIEYQGRPTVLKIAKNQKGLAQNSVEADILSDGYASQLGILIPIIDYDEQNREPTWVHTEMATKASEKQLCNIMGCDNLDQLVNMAWAITGKKTYVGNYQNYVTFLRQRGKTDEQIETMSEYANTLADLATSFDVELGDFTRAANWGMYNGKPVIIDVGFNSNVLNQYYKR
jgi:ribosomal protein S18 acetylase RimI-like enzyme